MMRILICDDEGIVRQSLEFIIQKSFGDKCEVESAKTEEWQSNWRNHFTRILY